MVKLIFEDDLKEELKLLENEYVELTEELKGKKFYHDYEQEEWNRRYEVIIRIKKISKLIKTKRINKVNT